MHEMIPGELSPFSSFTDDVLKPSIFTVFFQPFMSGCEMAGSREIFV